MVVRRERRDGNFCRYNKSGLKKNRIPRWYGIYSLARRVKANVSRSILNNAACMPLKRVYSNAVYVHIVHIVLIENGTVHNSAVADMGDKYTFNIVLFSFEPSGENERWRVKV